MDALSDLENIDEEDEDDDILGSFKHRDSLYSGKCSFKHCDSLYSGKCSFKHSDSLHSGKCSFKHRDSRFSGKCSFKHCVFSVLPEYSDTCELLQFNCKI